MEKVRFYAIIIILEHAIIELIKKLADFLSSMESFINLGNNSLPRTGEPLLTSITNKY